MIIDSHQHVFWHGRDDEGLMADLDAHAIDLAWLLTWEIPPQEDNLMYHRVLDPRNVREDGTHRGIPLEDVVRTARRYPGRFVAGYCPHPARPGAPAHLESAHRIHGVRVCGEWKFRMLLDDPRSLELFRKAGELGMPVVLHLDVPYLAGAEGTDYVPQWYGGTVENLERALWACPRTNFIGHAPGFWREISGDAMACGSPYPTGAVLPGGRVQSLLDTYSNLYADLSANSGRQALARDERHARDFLEKYSTRLLFGRDDYGGDLLALLKRLNLPFEIWENIAWRNAKSLIRAA